MELLKETLVVPEHEEHTKVKPFCRNLIIKKKMAAVGISRSLIKTIIKVKNALNWITI